MSIKGDIRKAALANLPPGTKGSFQVTRQFIFNMAQHGGLSTFRPETGAVTAESAFWRRRGQEIAGTITGDTGVTGKDLVTLLFSGKYDLMGCLGLMFNTYIEKETTDDPKYQSAENLYLGLRVAQIELEEYLLNTLGMRDWTVSRDIRRLGDEYAEQLSSTTFSKGEELGDFIEKQIIKSEVQALKTKRDLAMVRILLEGIAQCEYSESKTTIGVGGNRLWKSEGKDALERFITNVINNPQLSKYWITEVKGVTCTKFLSDEGLMKVFELSKENDDMKFSAMELLGAMDALTRKADNYGELMTDGTWANIFRFYLLTRLVQFTRDLFFVVAKDEKGADVFGQRFRLWLVQKEYLDLVKPKTYIEKLLKEPKAKKYVKGISTGSISPANLAEAAA